MPKLAKRYWPRIIALAVAALCIIGYSALNAWALSGDSTVSEIGWNLLFSPTVVVALVVVAGSLFVLMYRMGKAEGKIEQIDNTKLSQEMHKVICSSTHEKISSLENKILRLEEKIDMVLVSLSEKKVR